MPVDAPAWEDTEAIPTWDETRPLLSDAEMGQMAAKPPMQFLPGGMNEPGTREEKLQEAGAILGGAITAPGRAIDAVMPRWASEPLVNPQTAPSDLAFRKAHPVIGGVESAVVNLAKSFTSPIGIATLGMGALPGAAQRAVSLAFAGQMASSFPQLTDQIVQTYQQPDSPERTQELTRLFTEAAGTGAFTALATKHGLTPLEPILNRDQAMANRIAVRLSMPERLTISPERQAELGLPATPPFEETTPLPKEQYASSQQSAAPPDGGVRTRSEVDQLPEGNVEAADARLRGNEGEVPANLPPQEGTVGRGGAGQAPEAQKGVAPTLQDLAAKSATANDFIKAVQDNNALDQVYAWEKSTPERAAKYKDSGWFTIASDYFNQSKPSSVLSPPENPPKYGQTEGGGAGKVGSVETLKANERTTTEPTGPNQPTAAGTQSSQQLADSLRENVPLGEVAGLGDLRNAVQSYKSSPETSQLPQVLASYSRKAPWEITKREAVNLGESVPELKKIRNLAAAKAFQDKSDPAYKAAEKAFNQAREIAIEKLGIKGQNYNQGRGLDSQQLAERLSQKQAEDYHRQVIEDALKKGRHVPQNVIADYPDLAKKYGLSTTPPTTSSGVETKQPTNLRQPSTQTKEPTAAPGDKPTTPVVGEQSPALPVKPKAVEFQELQAKAKAGTLTPEEAPRYAELDAENKASQSKSLLAMAEANGVTFVEGDTPQSLMAKINAKAATDITEKPQGWSEERWQIFKKKRDAAIEAQKERNKEFVPPPSPAGSGEKGGSEQVFVVATSSHRQVQKLDRAFGNMPRGGLPVSLGSKTRTWEIPDTPENRAAAERAGFTIRVADTKRVNDRRARIAKMVEESTTPPPSEPPSGGAGAKPIGMGGAVPSEFAQSPQTPTSIKNAQVDIERAKRGLPPAIQPARKSFGAVWDEAMAKIDQDPGFQDRLLSELRDKPRALTDLEDALLLHRQIDLQNEYGKATRDLAQAYEDGRVDDVISEKARVQALSDALYDIYQIGKRVGTETGRGLNARRMMAFEDFTLAKMELEKRSIKDGAPLTDSERAEVQRLHDKIAATQKAYDDYVAATEKRDAERAIQDALREVEQKAKAEVEPHIRIIADKIKTYFDNRADAALKRLSGKLFTLSPQVLADLTDLGVSRILGGAARLPEWSVKMVEALGERIKPHLQTVWESSNRALDEHIQKVAGTGAEKVKRVVKGTDTTEKKTATTEAISEKVNSGQRNDITGLVQKLARLFVQEGIRNREELIDAVHGVLKGIDPEFTRRETMDAISGYGQFKQLSKDEISVRLRGMKGEMQQIAKLEDMAKGVPPSKTGLERRTPTDEERRLIKAVNEAKIQFQVPITDPLTQLKSALDTRKTQLENARKDYERRLAEKDFEKKPKRIIQFDAEANRLHFEAMKAKTAWHEAMMKDRLARRSIPAKIFGGALEAMNTARAVMTSMDLSAVLRQGGFIAFAHPVRAAKSFPAMFRAFRSEAGQHAVNQEILARKNYPLYQQSKLYLSEHGHKLSQMEEAYMTRWADKIPLVAGSQRAYVTFLNKLRADSFDAMANSLAREKELTANEANAISNFINVATGRGNLGMKENALVGLNSIFFAPRYVASRFQLLAGQPFYRGSARTRTLMAQEYGRFLIGVAIVYGLAKLDGAQIETDPRSADFGKLRYGNTRVDPLAGLLQTTVLLSRLASGETKTAGGHIVPIRGDKVPYGGADSAEVIGRFLRSKLSPALGTGLNVLTGKDVVGQPVTSSAIAQNLLIPLAWQDIYKTMREQGVDHGTAMAILSIFGMGLQNYDEKKKAPQPFKLPVLPKAPHLPVLPYYHTPQPSTNSITR